MTRIIAGRNGGTRLATPPGDRTRPTSERVREALFSAIASWAGTVDEGPDALAGMAFCDLYAGSGAIGLEAGSRGATAVTLVEKDKPTAAVIQRNAKTLGMPADVRSQSVETVVSAPAPRAHDVVWADPPYALAPEKLDEVFAAVVENGWVMPDGLLVTERARRGTEPTFPPPFTETWSRRYGETVLYFAMAPRDGEPEPAEETE